MRVKLAAVALSLAPGLSACSGGTTATAPDPSLATSSLDTPARSGSPAPAATSAGPSPADVIAQCEVAPCGGVDGTVVADRASTASFHSPSDNITCSLSEWQATCEINQRSFASPPKPADCQLDHGTMVSVATTGPASFLCHGDTAFVQATPFAEDSPIVGYGDVLHYGEQVTNGIFVCSSSTEHMACSTADGDHGFSLSRAEYRLY